MVTTRSAVVLMLAGSPAGPVGDVAEAVGGGGESGGVADDVGDAFGFDFGLAAAAGGVFGAVVHGGVGEFVGEGLGGLGGCEVGGDGDGPVREVGHTVGAAGDLGSGEGEPGGGDLGGEGVPETGGRFAFEELGPFGGLDSVAVGLGDVEDVGDPEPSQHPPGLPPSPLVGVGALPVAVASGPSAPLLSLLGLVGAGGEDADRLFAAADLVAEGLPGPIAHDDPGVGPLSEDQQLIAEEPSGIASDEGSPGVSFLNVIAALGLPRPALTGAVPASSSAFTWGSSIWLASDARFVRVDVEPGGSGMAVGSGSGGCWPGRPRACWRRVCRCSTRPRRCWKR